LTRRGEARAFVAREGAAIASALVAPDGRCAPIRMAHDPLQLVLKALQRCVGSPR